MANMSGIDTYINSTDERDNGTEPSGYGSTTPSERGNIAAPERSNAATSERNGGDTPLEHGNASPSEHDNTAAMQHDGNGAVSSECDNATSQQHSSTVSPERGNDVSSERSGNASPEHDDAIRDPKHAASAGEEAVDSSSHAEETSSDDRSGALTAKAASGESRDSHAAKATSDKGLGPHAAKATSGENHVPRAAETTSAYLQKAGDFLGLHKMATAIAAAIALCAVVGIGAAVASNNKPTPNSVLLSSGFASYAANVVATATDAAADEAAAGLIAQHLTPDAINSVDSFATAPGTFSLTEGEDATPLSEEQQESLVAATQNIEGGGYTVGFTLINLNTGKGIAYNLDSRVYGASSFKGPYAAYLCQHLGDNDASYPSGSEAAGSGVSSSIYSLIQPMILYSDNSAFSSLRNTYDSTGFAEWLNSCGVDSEIMHDTHFPRYSARESALLWLHTYQYLKTNTPTAQNLASLYEQTNVSFIRSGVSDDEEVEAVLNKAGWCSGRERFTGLCDAGLIKCTDGTTYLMSTMTNSPDGGLYTVRLANLASTLFECRDVLE